jgi:hypothetical protein
MNPIAPIAAAGLRGHARKYERPLMTKSFSSFRPPGSGLRPARGQASRSEEPEPRVMAEFLGSRFRGNECDQDAGTEMCARRSAGPRVGDDAARHRERRLERLIDRLPRRVQATIRWLRRPSSRRLRIPAGVLLIGGGLLSILPLFGLWMLPLGLVLLAEDVPSLRRARDRLLDWIERRRPRWLQGAGP